MADIFRFRKPAFKEGFYAFFDGDMENPYPENRSDRDFVDHREWQHGFDVAYLYNQAAVEEDERQRSRCRFHRGANIRNRVWRRVV
mgnify:CR=1 FL=1